MELLLVKEEKKVGIATNLMNMYGMILLSGIQKNNMSDTVDPKLHSVIVNAVIFDGDKVLVSQRSFEEAHEPGKWTIPGGKIDRTEGDVFNIIEDTLAREVMEETGVEIEKEVQMITNNTFIRSNGQHVIAMVFKCKY